MKVAEVASSQEQRQELLAILWVEDDPESVEGDVSTLERAGIEVVTCKNLAIASLLVSERRFGLLCVDQRLPYEETYRYRGGEEFIVEVKGGEHGDMNMSTPFVLVTADASWIDQERLATLPGYLGIITKESWITDRLLHYLRDHFDLARIEMASDRMRATAVIVDRERLDGVDHVNVLVSSWNPHESVRVPYRSLPDELQQEIDSFGCPVDISCTFFGQAVVATELDLRDIERVPQVTDEDDLDAVSDT